MPRRRDSVTLAGAAFAAGAVFLTACSGASENAAGVASPAPAGNAVGIELTESALGPILSDQNGHTLYAFIDDKPGSSSCSADCLATWPALVSRQPVVVGAGVAKSLVSTANRAEGTVQTTYGDWPLYYYVGDQGTGDVDGQGVDGLWFVIGADGKLIKTDPSTS